MKKEAALEKKKLLLQKKEDAKKKKEEMALKKQLLAKKKKEVEAGKKRDRSKTDNPKTGKKDLKGGNTQRANRFYERLAHPPPPSFCIFSPPSPPPFPHHGTAATNPIRLNFLAIYQIPGDSNPAALRVVWVAANP